MTSPRPLLRRFVDYQHDAWFGPGDARALAIARVLIFGTVWPAFEQRDYAGYVEFAESGWYPVSFFRAWSVPLLDLHSLQALALVSWVALLFAALGLGFRVAAPVAAFSTLYLHGVPQNFGKVNHAENLLMIALFVLACSRASDAWSVDAWLRRRRRSAPALVPQGGWYRWPLRFVGLMVVTMYAAAGCSKLIHSSWTWALSPSFQRLLLRHHFTHHPPTEIGVWIASMPAVCQGLALGALLTELAAPLALLGAVPFGLLVSALFAMQTGIYLLIGVKFESMVPMFLCLLPWQRMLAAMDRRRVAGQVARNAGV